MGTPKALLTIGGRTFLERLSLALGAGGCSPVLAVVADPATHGRLSGVELVVNPDPSRGQTSSLLCARDAVPEADGLLVVLVDQADLAAATVRAVRLALERAPLAVACHQGRPGHPTAFARQLFAALDSPEVRSQGARALVAIQAELGRVAWVEVDDPGVVRNLNRPEDLADLEIPSA